MKRLVDALSLMQRTLKVKKNQLNKFGGFNYRTVEDITTIINAELPESFYISTHVNFNVDLIEVIVGLSTTDEDGKEISIKSNAYAFYDESHGKMSREQKCGAAISYARKYALCNLFNIGTGDDDIDSLEQTAPKGVKKKNDNLTPVNYVERSYKYIEKDEDLNIIKDKYLFMFDKAPQSISDIKSGVEKRVREVVKKKLDELTDINQVADLTKTFYEQFPDFKYAIINESDRRIDKLIDGEPNDSTT